MKSLARKLARWYDHNARDLPWRRTRDPYAVWISEIMLQQTQVKTVIPYFERWMRALPTIQAFAQARPEMVLKLWEGLGYYSRARNAQAAAQQILRQHGGRFPEAFDAVLALPGVGRYTAGAICSIAFNQPVPILDGNVIRVATRLFGVAGNPRDKLVNAKLWSIAAQLVAAPGIEPARLNQALMELGALVCLPQQPRCAECPVRPRCFAFRENRIAEFPALSTRPPATKRHFVALIVRRRDRFLVRRRPPGVVNAGFWEFPNYEVGISEAAPFVITGPQPFFRVRHSITRYRILLEAFEASLSAPAKAAGLWKTRGEMKKLPFTSAHRKIVVALQTPAVKSCRT